MPDIKDRKRQKAHALSELFDLSFKSMTHNTIALDIPTDIAFKTLFYIMAEREARFEEMISKLDSRVEYLEQRVKDLENNTNVT